MFTKLSLRSSGPGEQLIQRCLKVVEKILDTTKNPQLAGDVDHQYDDKYYLVELMTNTAIASILNVFEKLDGFNEDLFQQMVKKVKDENRTVTLRFMVQSKCEFLKEETIEVESPTSFQATKEESIDKEKGGKKKPTKTKTVVTHKVMNKVKENHWNVEISHSLMLFTGTDQEKGGVVLGNRTATSTLITTMKNPPLSSDVGFKEDMNLTWLFKWIDPPTMKCHFSIDREKARTPRRNDQVEEALVFMQHLTSWSSACQKVRTILDQATPEKNKHVLKNKINSDNIFVPILPLFLQDKPSDDGNDDEATDVKKIGLVSLKKESPGDSPVLPLRDVSQFLEEQCRSLQTELHESMQKFPDDEQVFSSYEAMLIVLWSHLKDLSSACKDGIDYIEYLLYEQLVHAIGKEVKQKDFNSFLRFHNQRLFPKLYAPKPFCYAIRQPNQYPDGVLSIVADGFKDANDPIETFVRHIPGDTMLSPMSIPLNAATTVEFIGDRYLHGWMDTFFASDKTAPIKHYLNARARQFSCFLVVTGTISGPDEFTPQDAIILQNKDDVLIPLLIQDLPPAKEFKDAIKSLSPEQARFAKQFRAMQLGSSLFGVCVIQVKPQLEALLNLPPNSLMKEMKLTQDLLSLFVEYQIPSSLVSYDDSHTNASTHDKLSAVKTHVKGVMDVIEGLKDSQLKEEVKKADMRAEFNYAANMSRVQTEEERKAQAMGDALSWLRSNKCDQAEERKAQAMGDSLSWLRSNKCDQAEVIDCANGFQLSEDVAADVPRVGKKSAPTGGGEIYVRADGKKVRRVKKPSVTASGDSSAGGLASFLDKGVSDKGSKSGSATVAGDMVTKQEGKVYIQADGKKARGNKHNNNRDDFGWGKSEAVDWTLIPKKLDGVFEEFDSSNSLRTIVLNTGDQWTRERQENLLSKSNKSNLGPKEQKTERSKAMDLLDALSRSGSLPIASGELHVLVGVRHAFERNVMETVIGKNINPIEKVDYSSLLIASSIHNVTIPTLLTGSEEPPTQALAEGKFPSLMLEDHNTSTED